MSKSKNHTAHNQTFKDHRNGVKKPLRERYPSLRGVNSIYKRNLRRARKFDPSIKKEVNLTKKIQKRIENKVAIQEKINEAIIAQKMNRGKTTKTK